MFLGTRGKKTGEETGEDGGEGKRDTRPEVMETSLRTIQTTEVVLTGGFKVPTRPKLPWTSGVLSPANLPGGLVRPTAAFLLFVDDYVHVLQCPGASASQSSLIGESDCS